MLSIAPSAHPRRRSTRRGSRRSADSALRAPFRRRVYAAPREGPASYNVARWNVGGRRASGLERFTITLPREATHLLYCCHLGSSPNFLFPALYSRGAIREIGQVSIKLSLATGHDTHLQRGYARNASQEIPSEERTCAGHQPRPLGEVWRPERRDREEPQPRPQSHLADVTVKYRSS